MSKIINFLKSDRGKSFLACLAAVIMYFTPDPIDEVITALLAMFGITTLVVHKKEI